MNLTTYNTLNTPSSAYGKPCVNFDSSGVIRISKALAEMVGVEHGTRVEICHNDDEPGDWYLNITTADTAFEVRERGLKKNLIFNSKGLAMKVINSIDSKAKTITFQVSRAPMVIEGVSYWYLIQRTAIKDPRKRM